MFWSNRSLIAAGTPAWPPVQKAERCQALVLLPIPSDSSTPELCQGQNTASIQAVENTRDCQNLWKSKTTRFGSRQWQMPRCPHLHTCICSFYHLCNCLKATRDYLVAPTDALCINLLPSSGSALRLNEVWNHVWAGQLLNNSRGKENWEKEEGRQKSKGMVPGRSLRADGVEGGLICAVYSAPESYTVTHLPSPPPPPPGKVLIQQVLAHEMSKTAHLCGWWTFQSQCRRWAGEKVLASTWGACKCFFAPLKRQRSN